MYVKIKKEKLELKSNEKRGILILILVVIIIIGIMFAVTRGSKNNSKDTNQNINNEENIELSQVDPSRGEFTKTESDGTVVNTSDKLKEDKVESELKYQT